jgi:phosphoglycolate phosphatase
MDVCVPQKERKINAVVFDFDGTLAHQVIDFTEMKRRVAAAASAWLGRRPEPNGTPALEWIEELARDIEVGQAGQGRRFFDAAHAVIRDMECEAASRGGLFPFVRKMLRDLGGRGVDTAIITRNCAQAVEAVFPDALDYCRAVLPREAVARVKPDPGHLRSAMEILGALPETTLMVGDHPLDIETGRRAGTRTAGWPRGGYPGRPFSRRARSSRPPTPVSSWRRFFRGGVMNRRS